MIQFTKDLILSNMAPVKGMNHLRFHLNLEGYSVSIIGGGMAYGDGKDTFEVMITRGHETVTSSIFAGSCDSAGQVAGYLPIDKVVYELNNFFDNDKYV